MPAAGHFLHNITTSGVSSVQEWSNGARVVQFDWVVWLGAMGASKPGQDFTILTRRGSVALLYAQGKCDAIVPPCA